MCGGDEGGADYAVRRDRDTSSVSNSILYDEEEPDEEEHLTCERFQFNPHPEKHESAKDSLTELQSDAYEKAHGPTNNSTSIQ